MQGKGIRFARKTVWMCKDEISSDTILGFKTTSHVQRKNRPVLIISNDIGNSHSPILNVVPLTSKDKRSSVSVPICQDDGTLGCILCNQMKTIDSSSLYEYLFTVDDETMLMVEKTIQYVLAFKPQRIDKSLAEIEQLINDIMTMKFKGLSSREEFDNIVEKVAEGLENNYKLLMENYIKNLNSASDRIKEKSSALLSITNSKSSNDQNYASNNDATDTKVIINNVYKNDDRKKPRGYWTKDRKLKYVEDAEKHTDEWMMNNYEIDSVAQVKKKLYQYKYEIKKLGLDQTTFENNIERC